MSKLIVLAISLLAMILTSRLHPPAAVRIAAKGTRDVMSAYTAAPPAPSRKTASDENAVLAVRSANPNGVGPDQLPASAAKNPPLGYGSRPVAPQSIASAAGAGPTQTPAAGNDRKMGDAATPQAVPGESSRSQTEHSALPQFSDADMQPGSSGPSVAAGETASISGVGQSPEHAPEKGGNQTGADNNASHQGNENTKDAKSAQNAQSGQNQAGSRQAAGGQGGQNKDSTGGQGSGSGTSGAKKSRGAGTGLLGVHTADLFTGRDLPGPDQTRSIPTGPISQDLAPAAPALAPDRREDEPTLDVTHISPDDDALLDKYFSQLHQPPALPQHPSTREALPAAQ